MFTAPPTSQLGLFQVPSGFLLVGIQLLCCYSPLTGIPLVITLLMSPVSHSLSPSISWGLFMGIHSI